MYSEGLVVGKPSTIEISHTPHIIFTRDQKMRNLASFSTTLNFKPPAFEHAARYPNGETNFLCRNDSLMSPPSLVKLDPRTTDKALSVLPNPKIAHENVLNR